MKYHFLLALLILFQCAHVHPMGREDEIKLEIYNQTSRIVAVFDQQEKYDDVFPNPSNSPHTAHQGILLANYHRSYKICAPAEIYTLLFQHQQWSIPIVQLCIRSVREGWRGPVPENNPICEIQIGDSRLIRVTIKDTGHVLISKK